FLNFGGRRTLEKIDALTKLAGEVARQTSAGRVDLHEVFNDSRKEPDGRGYLKQLSGSASEGVRALAEHNLRRAEGNEPRGETGATEPPANAEAGGIRQAAGAVARKVADLANRVIPINEARVKGRRCASGRLRTSRHSAT